MKTTPKVDSKPTESNQSSSHPEKAEIADFAIAPEREICWDVMERRLAILEQPELVYQVGSALPALLFVVNWEGSSVASQPLPYSQIAEALSCSLSTVKKWMADLEGLELVHRNSCGKAGVVIELVGDALGESADLRRVRELVKSLQQQVASIRQVLDSSLAATMDNLNKLAS